MKKHYYATGNGGNGTQVYAFVTTKERDEFVAWDTNYDQRSAITRISARRYGQAIIIEKGQMVPGGHGPATIKL